MKTDGYLYRLVIGPRGIHRPGIVHLAMQEAHLVVWGCCTVVQCDETRPRCGCEGFLAFLGTVDRYVWTTCNLMASDTIT